jgi:hypothetical protein
MPRRRKNVLADLPEPGTVFAMPLADGRTGICRILRRVVQDIPCVLVATSDWIAEQPPALNDPAVRRFLTLTHHNWSGKPEMLWIGEPPPKEFRNLGRIEVLRKDTKTDCGSCGSWESLPLQVLMQWRWEHDHEAVEAEDAAKKVLETTKRAEGSRKRAEYLSTVSFADLLAKDLFLTWDEYPPKAAKKSCQRIIQSFIRSLDDGSKPLPEDFVRQKLKECVQAINRLDSEQNGFVETIEREDLCDVLEVVLNAAKFPGLMENVEDWRDW